MHLRAFATDYDGTLAHHGSVDPATVDAVMELKQAGVKTLMVTGREIPDLHTVFSEVAIFDIVVAENGALLYWPATKEERCLATPPPRTFPDLLRATGVKDLSVGKVIVASTEIYSGVIEKAITDLRLDLEIILNKGSVMVLPKGVDKGFGLRAACQHLNIPPAEVVAVGDAENDLPFLRVAGYGVAVENALPEVKAQARWVTPSGHGGGVRELIARMMNPEENKW